MGAATRFIMSEPEPWDHMIGNEAHEGGADRHHLGAHAFNRAMDDGFGQIFLVTHQAFFDRVFIGEIEEEQHEDARFGVQARQRDHARPRRRWKRCNGAGTDTRRRR